MPGSRERVQSAPCYEDLDFSPEDGKEIERQKSLLQHTFTDSLYTGNPRSMMIVEDLRFRIKKICDGEGTVSEFLVFQSQKFKDPEYAFLVQSHPGLNVTGWGVLLAELDPLKYGTGMKRVLGTGGTSWRVAHG